MAALPIKPDTAQSACPDLTASPQLLRTIFDALPQRIFWKDTQGRFLGCNRQFAEDFGFASSQDICGKTNEDLGLPDDLVTQYQLADAEVLTTGRPQWQQEHYKTYRDGRQGWVRATKVPLSGTEGGRLPSSIPTRIFLPKSRRSKRCNATDIWWRQPPMPSVYSIATTAIR
jgi:PAS domain S-box-containing protein